MRHGTNTRRRAWKLRAAMLAAGAALLWGTVEPRLATAQDAAGAVPESPAQGAIADAEADLQRLDALEREWRERSAATAAAAAARLEEVAALEARLAAAAAGSEAASAVFERSKELVRAAAADLRAAIARGEAPSEAPPPRHEAQEVWEAFPTSGRPLAATAAETERLADLEKSYEAKARELAALELELRQAAIDHHAAYASRLWRVRLGALEKLPPALREDLSSFTRERWREILFDFDVARLVVELRWYRLRLLVARLPHGVRDLFAAATVGGALLRILLVVLSWRFVQRRWPRLIERLRRRAEGLGRARVAVDLAEAAAPWGIFLLAVWALLWALGVELRELPFPGPGLFILTVIYGVYRLAADLGVAVLVAGAGHTAFEVTAERKARMERGIRRVLRVALVVILLPAVYGYQLEGGVLYDALRELAWWAVAAALLLALASWRRELADACLAMRATGRWPKLLRRTRDNPLGYLLAPLSFLWLAARGLGALGHEIASGHRRTRLATAFLARRRIEKEARERGHADVDLATLPAGLAEALDEWLRPGDAEALDHVPGLDDALAAVAAWRRGEGGGSFLLAGEHGIGKRAWVDNFCARETAAERLALNRRLLEPQELVAWLGRGLFGAEAPPADRAELRARLGDGARRIVVLEGAENLFLGRVDGYRALSEMAALASETRLEVFWMLSMEGLALDHLRAAAKELASLGRIGMLPAWQEPQIRELLRRRLAAGGFTARYAGLLGEAGSGEDSAIREREGEKAFVSLLADHAGGNPRVALHFFLRSLVPGRDGRRPGELEVRPFRPPAEDELAGMSDEAYFLLAAVARHGALTLEEVAAVTAYRPAVAGILMTRLFDLGVLAAEGDRFFVTIHWQATVLRFLRRRNVLVS